MKLSEIKQILAAEGIQLTKSLGQNFLHDGNQLRRIVAAAELKRTDKVLEIGPGLGPLTELLLNEAGEVLAIEKDVRLVKLLHKRFGAEWAAPQAGDGPPSAARAGGAAALRLVQDDALAYLRRETRDWSDWKLVANLPYSVASPLLVELAQSSTGPRRMVATLQLEVARRLMAGPGDKDYGVLTLLVQLDYEASDWFRIPAGCFFPEPEVDSACVCLRRRGERLLTPEVRSGFVRIVKQGFCQRRKMLLKLLKRDWAERKLAEAFERLGIAPESRAESIGLEQFVRLAQLLAADS